MNPDKLETCISFLCDTGYGQATVSSANHYQKIGTDLE